MTAGEDVKRARGRLRLTQQELGDQVGVSRRTIAEWESMNPLPATAEGRLSAVLTISHNGQTVETILAGVSDMELIAELARRVAYLRAHQNG